MNMTKRALSVRLQVVYDILLKGENNVPGWDRLVALSAVGEAIDIVRVHEQSVSTDIKPDRA